MKIVTLSLIALLVMVFLIDGISTYIKYKKFKKRLATAKYVRVFSESIAQHNTGEYHKFKVVGIEADGKTVMLSDGSHASSYWIQDLFNQNFEIID